MTIISGRGHRQLALARIPRHSPHRTVKAPGTPGRLGPLPVVLLTAGSPPDDGVALESGLREEGYDLSYAATSSFSGQHEIRRLPHVVLFRLTRPESLTHESRSKASTGDASSLPAIVHLVDQAEEDERIAALDSGVDDVVVLPVSVRELAARIRAIIRRSVPAARRSLLTCEDIVLDLVAGQATRAGRRLALTRKEFRLLQVLMENFGRPVSRERLIEEVWGPGRYLDMRTVDAHIHRLRGAIGDPEFDVIRTVRHAGYVIGQELRTEGRPSASPERRLRQA